MITKMKQKQLDHNSRPERRIPHVLHRVFALLAAGFGLAALFGWIAGLPLLTTLANGLRLMAPSTALLLLLFGIVGILLLGAGAVVGLVWRQQRLQYYREKYEIKEALRVKAWAIESAPNAIVTSDLEGNLSYVNPAFLKMWGYSSSAEVLGKSVIEFWQMGEKAVEVMDALRTRGGWTGELVAHGKNGALFEVQIAANRTVDATGKPVCMEASFVDITEHKKAEDALRESEERHRILFEDASDALMIIEPPSWKFTRGNPATLEMFKAKDEEEFISQGPWDVSPDLQPDGRASAEKAKEMIETAMRDGSCFFEWTHKRMNGEDFSATVLLSRIKQGEKTFIQATVRDITRQKQLEQQLKDKIADLEQYKKVTVGREHKMIELKKEINELCKQTNQKPRYEEV